MYRIDTQSGRGDKESINPHVRLVIKIFVENEGVPKKFFGEIFEVYQDMRKPYGN